jgi:hypothetical protein
MHMRLRLLLGLPLWTCVGTLNYLQNAVQETKLQEQHVADAQQELGLEGWSHWNGSTIMKGDSGTAIISRCVSGLSVCNRNDSGHGTSMIAGCHTCLNAAACHRRTMP